MTDHPDYRYFWLTNAWIHPETLVTIFDEDMPYELRPFRDTREEDTNG